ncbi:MAG: type II toxin-antitoxin system Phd/YefM family antitoxin [Armatimonadetes bacterium]|nr:type II toxin-antitoxin system Phd/YefM family antitoxin [Armatimonadota bacterium]
MASHPRVATVSELRTHTAKLLEDIAVTKRPVHILKRKKPTAVLCDAGEYDRLRYERDFFAAIAEGRRDVAERDVEPHAEVMREMREWLTKTTR